MALDLLCWCSAAWSGTVCGWRLCSAFGSGKPVSSYHVQSSWNWIIQCQKQWRLISYLSTALTLLSCMEKCDTQRCNSSADHWWCPVENFNTNRKYSPCVSRRMNDPLGWPFDLHSSETGRGARKSTASLSAERTAFPRLDPYCWEQEPARTTESRATSEVWQHGKMMRRRGNVCSFHFFYFSGELTWQTPVQENIMRTLPLKPVWELRIKGVLMEAT